MPEIEITNELPTTEKSRLVIQQAFSPNGVEWMPWISGPRTDGHSHTIQTVFEVGDQALAEAVLNMLRVNHKDETKRKFRLIKQVSTWIELA